MTMRKSRGFSLIELLIVVAIILVIAAIAIPNLMRARMSANDASAAGSVRTLTAAEVSYVSAYPTVGYPLTMVVLGGAAPCVPGPSSSCIVDNYLATNGNGNGKSGYSFNAVGSASAGNTFNDQFLTTGIPVSTTTGSRSYCSIEDGVVRLQPAGTTTIASSHAACGALGPMQ